MRNYFLAAVLFLGVGCNSVRRLTGMDRHDAEQVDTPIARGLIRDLPPSGDVSFSPTLVSSADTVRVYVKNDTWRVASPGGWYEIPYAVEVGTATTEYAVINFAAQTARVYNQPSAAARAIVVNSIPTGAHDPGRPSE